MFENLKLFNLVLVIFQVIGNWQSPGRFYQVLGLPIYVGPLTRYCDQVLRNMPNQTIAIFFFINPIYLLFLWAFLAKICPDFNYFFSFFFRYKIIAALVTILIAMCCPKDTYGAPYPVPGSGRRKGSASKHKGKVIHHTCTESNSYFFRSQCSDNGFLTVVKNRVLVQTTGLDMFHRDGKLNIVYIFTKEIKV